MVFAAASNLKNKTSIVLFAYNRPIHLKRTVEALLKNETVSLYSLIIYCDGPKSGALTNDIDAVRRYTFDISGFKKVEVIQRSENLGLAESIISGVTEVLRRYERVIVLEDDIVTAPSFLKYMNSALDYFEDDERVISIHGYLPPLDATFDRPFFLRGADCWGWATWRRGWQLFERDGGKLLVQLKERRLERQFNLDNSYPYAKMLEDQVRGKNSSWAIRWHASAFLNDKLTLHPPESLVQNIGHDGSGRHCGVSALFATTLGNYESDFRNVPIEHCKFAESRFIALYKGVHRKKISTIMKNLLSKVGKSISKLVGVR